MPADSSTPRYRVRLTYDVSYFDDNFELETTTCNVMIIVKAYSFEQAQALAWKQQRQQHIGCWSLNLLSAEPRKIPVRKSWRAA